MSEEKKLMHASIQQLLKWDNSAPGDANRFKLVMLHRTIEAMNGLSNRLDNLVVEYKDNGIAQERQQKATNRLSLALVLCTVVYTGITGWSAYEAANAFHGTSKTAVALSCLEFANSDDQSFFNSTGIIRSGAKVSNKSASECKGIQIANQ
jgi:hypothetical protein